MANARPEGFTSNMQYERTQIEIAQPTHHISLETPHLEGCETQAQKGLELAVLRPFASISTILKMSASSKQRQRVIPREFGT